MRTCAALLAPLTAVVLMWNGTGVYAQAPRSAPTFEVVSVRRVIATGDSNLPVAARFEQRPDGGVAATNITVATLIARAYPSMLLVDIPEWAQRERYDVRATSSLPSATSDDRLAMLRTMLADRFKLAVRLDKREQPAFSLVVSRRDGTLGSGLRESTTQCPRTDAVAQPSEPSSRPQIPDFKVPPPPCTLRIVGALMRDRGGDGQGHLGDLLEGEATMAGFADMLRMPTGRQVVDYTGLQGIYRIVLNFNSTAARVGPTIAPSAGPSGPSVFDAVEAQLGLKLESSRVLTEVLVVEHLDRPTEN